MARAPGRPIEPVLSRDAIVDAASRLVERDGLAAFSVHALAESLGVTPRAVRYRLGSRDAVLLAVAELVTSDIPLPDTGLEWEDWLRLTATAVRAALVERPALIPVVLDAWSSTTRGTQLAATSLDVLVAAADGDLAAAVSAHNAFWAFLAGVVYSHGRSSLRGSRQGTVDALATVADQEAVLAALDRLSAAYAAAYPQAQPLDVAFASALDVALTGVRTAIAGTGALSVEDR